MSQGGGAFGKCFHFEAYDLVDIFITLASKSRRCVGLGTFIIIIYD